MDHKQIINQRQLAWLTASMISSVGMLNLQNELIRLGKLDAWLSYFLPIAYIFILASFFAYLCKKFPRKNIFEISLLLLGKWGGTCLNVILLVHFWMILIRDVCSLSKFTNTVLLERTPLEILVLLPCLVLLYFGRTSVEVIARVNDVFYPLFLVSVVLMPLLLSNEIRVGLLKPVLTTPPLQILYANFLAFGGVGDVFVIGAFLHILYNSDQFRSSIRHGALLGMGTLTTILLLEIMVLGPKIPGNYLYPPYSLVQMIHVTDFLDRLDIFMLIIWFPAIMCKILAVYLALLLGISSFHKHRNYPIFNKPTALLVAITTLTAFRSTTELLAYSNFGTPMIALCYQPLVMFVLMVAVKRRSGSLLPHKDSSGDPPAARVNKNKASILRLSSLSYKNCMGISNGLLAAAGLIAGVGLIYGHYAPKLSVVNSAGYLLCIVLLVWTTHRELIKLQQLEKIENVPAAGADTSI